MQGQNARAGGEESNKIAAGSVSSQIVFIFICTYVIYIRMSSMSTAVSSSYGLQSSASGSSISSASSSTIACNILASMLISTL